MKTQPGVIEIHIFLCRTSSFMSRGEGDRDTTRDFPEPFFRISDCGSRRGGGDLDPPPLPPVKIQIITTLSVKTDKSLWVTKIKEKKR